MMVSLLVLFLLVCPVSLSAAPVGFLSQVEGKVDILRQGQPPGVPAHVQDQVAAGDVIRTKSQSRAQIRFVDDTTLAIAPGSLVVIEAYIFDTAHTRRQALLQVLRGLVHCVVQRVYQLEQPDFLIRTFTAHLGVRGTRWFTLVGVNYVGGFVESGLVEMSSVLAHLPKRVLIAGGEYAVTRWQREPTDPQRYSPETLDLLRRWLIAGVPLRVLQNDPGAILWQGSPGGSFLPPGLGQPGRGLELPEGLFVPPTLKPGSPPPTPSQPGGSPYHPSP